MAYHYCFSKEVNVITAYKPLMAMVNKDVSALSQWLQCIMLCIHQYNMHILYKPGLDLYIADWQSHYNQKEGKDQEIVSMNINIHKLCMAIDVPVCISIEEIRNAMSTDAELQMLQTYIISG